METKINPVIIIGMHRSGTSMMTRFMEESGIFMGADKRLNDESLFFQSINIWSLFQANCTWDNPNNFKYANDYLIENLRYAIEKRLLSTWMRKYLGPIKFLKYRSVRNLDHNWGWKDPRNTILMPVWNKIFPGARIIHVYRNPIDVAASLRARELAAEKRFRRRFRVRKNEYFLLKRPAYYYSSRVHDLEQGVELWKEYTARAFNAEAYFKYVMHLKYEDLLQDPQSLLKKTGEFLNVDINQTLIESIRNQIDSSRSYAFLKDGELTEVYKKVRSDSLVSKCGYGDLLENH